MVRIDSRPISRFEAFALLYMAAIILGLNRWPLPVSAAGMLPILVITAATRVTRLSFLVFLGFSSAFLLRRFPELDNHANIELYLNFVLGFGIVYSWVRPVVFRDLDDVYELIRPLLQATTIVMYVMAGFHKLNADFFNPHVSCARDFGASLSLAWRSTTFGVLLAASVAGGLVVGWRKTRERPLARLTVSAAVCAAVLALLLSMTLTGANWAGGILHAFSAPAVLGMATLIVLWELAGGAVLLVARLQAPVIAFSFLMHASLALVGFVDFGALAVVLLFSFVPGSHFELFNRPVRLPGIGLLLNRVRLYVAVAVIITLLQGVPWVREVLAIRLYRGLLFNFAAITLLWPLLTCLHSRSPCPTWRGTALTSRVLPPWMWALTALLVLHGLTGYLGLRTAGNFSMFSNLRTEGTRSNHWLLGGNWLKGWGYQEDVVHILAIDDNRAAVGHRYGPLHGYQLPGVEFRKRILRWTQSGMTVPVTFTYRDQLYVTKDIVNDPAWRSTGRDLAMRLMDFRPIQPEGPNQCRW